jgi:hypothetical protein
VKLIPMLTLALFATAPMTAKAVGICETLLQKFGVTQHELDLQNLASKHNWFAELKGMRGTNLQASLWVSNSNLTQGPILLLEPGLIESLPRGTILWGLVGERRILGVDKIPYGNSTNSLHWGVRPIDREFDPDIDSTKLIKQKQFITLQDNLAAFLMTEIDTRFRQAQTQDEIETLWNNAEDVISELQKPLKTTPPLSKINRTRSDLGFYERLRLGEFGDIETIWGQLGLNQKFSKLFPKETQFWSSSKSLVEIYLELRVPPARYRQASKKIDPY